MIVVDLRCEHDHRFEGWFASAEAFSEQRERDLVQCPVCASRQVERLPSAPYVQTRTTAPAAGTSSAAPPAGSDASDNTLQLLRKMRELSRQAEDVGKRLPEEARRIHYGETEARDIRGQASGDEVRELLEEGIIVLPLPPGDDELH